MPLPGGASDKYGLRYELLWTVDRIVDVMEGKASYIHLEPPGPQGEGVEFFLENASGIEFHQVKRQKSGQGRWSLSALQSEAVLSRFYDKLHNSGATCVFISTHAAYPLDELTDRARSADSWEGFKRLFLASAEHSANFADLHKKWHSSSEETSYELLQRVKVRTIDEESLRITVQNRLETLVEGDSATVVDVLSHLALDRIYLQLTSGDVWNHLVSRGFSQRNWGQDPSVSNAVEEQNRRYLAPLKQAHIAGQVIARTEVEQVLEVLQAVHGKRGVLLTGEAGTGKSLTIPQVIEKVQEQNWLVLAFRVDRLDPTQLPKQLKRCSAP